MVCLEHSVEPHLGQLGVDIGQLVVGEDQACHLVIVLWSEGEGGVREVVVGEVHYGGVRREGGEVERPIRCMRGRYQGERKSGSNNMNTFLGRRG